MACLVRDGLSQKECKNRRMNERNLPKRLMYNITINGKTKKTAIQCGKKKKPIPHTAATPLMVVKMSSSIATA